MRCTQNHTLYFPQLRRAKDGEQLEELSAALHSGHSRVHLHGPFSLGFLLLNWDWDAAMLENDVVQRQREYADGVVCDEMR